MMIALINNAGAGGTRNLKQLSKHAKTILMQLHFMNSFVEDLLNLHMIHEGHMSISTRAFDLKDTIEFVVKMFAIKSE